MPACDEDLRTQVGVAPADRRPDVDDGPGAARHQGLGADAVEVDVVDDGDLARAQASGEVLGAPVDAHDAADSRQVGGAASA